MLFEAKGLSKKYGRLKALEGVSFTLKSGQTLGVIGESGAGKSTLMRLALGLTRSDAGEIWLDSRPVGATRPPASGSGQAAGVKPVSRLEFCRAVQAVFQDPTTSLDPRMRVGETLREPLAIHGQASWAWWGGGRARIDASIREALAAVGLSEFHLNRYPRELSGGECQRVAIARAIILKPRVLVCDEAVSSLDPILRAGILNVLLELQRERGLAMLFISHDLRVVRHMSDEVLVLKEGRVCETGPRDQVFGSPQHPYTRQLLGTLGSLAKADPADL